MHVNMKLKITYGHICMLNGIKKKIRDGFSVDAGNQRLVLLVPFLLISRTNKQVSSLPNSVTRQAYSLLAFSYTVPFLVIAESPTSSIILPVVFQWRIEAIILSRTYSRKHFILKSGFIFNSNFRFTAKMSFLIFSTFTDIQSTSRPEMYLL